MLATPRRLLLALVALAACTPVFADVSCSPNVDGSWTCRGDGTGGNPDQPVFTNVVGVCTNCVAISPSECSDMKSGLNDLLMEISLRRSAASDALLNAEESIDKILDEGDTFTGPAALSLNDYRNSPQYEYAMTWNMSASPSAQGVAGAAVNSIANYYQQGVKPTLYEAKEYLSYCKDFLDSQDSYISSMGSLIESINCSACTASFDGGGGGSGSGGSLTNSPSSCPDCPCKEQMEALHDLLKDDFLPRIKKIDTNVAQLTNLITIARDQLRVTKEGFHNVTNLFNRLDDYVLDDFSNRVYQIRYDVNFIASNLVQRMQRIFIDQSYSNAQFYVRQDSDTPVEMADLDETLIPEGDMSKFDWGEFENLSWFTRVEYLLLKLNGVYVSTNNSANAGVSKAEENQKAIEDGFSDFKSSVNGDIKTGFTRVGTSVSTFFSSFNSAVSTQGDKVVEINLMSNFIGQEPLMLNIDPDVADACRTISSLLWTVLFGFLLYKIMIYFWVVFVDTINWWVNQTQGFVK